jgi:hypothetical protein
MKIMTVVAAGATKTMAVTAISGGTNNQSTVR